MIRGRLLWAWSVGKRRVRSVLWGGGGKGGGGVGSDVGEGGWGAGN